MLGFQRVAADKRGALDELWVGERDALVAAGVGGVSVVGEGIRIVIVIRVVGDVGIGVIVVRVARGLTRCFVFGLEGCESGDSVWIEFAEGEGVTVLC